MGVSATARSPSSSPTVTPVAASAAAWRATCPAVAPAGSWAATRRVPMAARQRRASAPPVWWGSGLRGSTAPSRNRAAWNWAGPACSKRPTRVKGRRAARAASRTGSA